jgi:nicotinamidase-related amidase
MSRDRAREPLPHAFDVDDDAALVVIDVQAGFDDPWWGPRNNPAADDNIAALVDAFIATSRPLVVVRHDSAEPDSPLHPSRPGNQLKDYLTQVRRLEVHKSVNSSFHGTPDLDGWLRAHGIRQLVITGITTNHCCETTARVGGNLGYDVLFALDATHTFDRTGPDGRHHTADELAAVTAANLHEEFATVVTTDRLLAAVLGERPEEKAASNAASG